MMVDKREDEIQQMSDGESSGESVVVEDGDVDSLTGKMV